MTVDGPMVQAIAAMFGLVMLSAAFWMALRWGQMAKIDWKDPEARRAYDRKRNRENYRKKSKDPEFKEKERKRKKEKILTNKTKAIEHTGGLRCHNPNCVYIKHNESLELCQVDFHHVITQNKTGEFCQLFKCSWEKVKEEIDNCAAIPLCSYCHKVEEHGTI